MKPVVARWVVALLLGCGVSGASAQLLNPLDGRGSLRFVTANTNVILCEKSATGQTQSELICLDTQRGKVRWRQPVSSSVDGAYLAPDGFVYSIAGNILSKRKAENGQTVWSMELAPIPAQKSPPIWTLREQLGQAIDKAKEKYNAVRGNPSFKTFQIDRYPLDDTANRFFFSGPFLTGNHLLIGREGISGSGCVITRCFEDWIVVDAGDGHFLCGGDGPVLGRVGDGFVIGGENPRLVVSGTAKRTPEVDKVGRATTTHLSGFVEPAHESQESGRLLIEESGSNSGTMYELIRVMDESGATVLNFQPAPAPCPQAASEWILAGQHLLRCMPGRFDDNGPADTQTELYDISGRLLRRTSAATLGFPQASSYRFLGRTSKHDLIFEGDNKIVVLAVPSLALKHSHQFLEPKSAGDDTRASFQIEPISGTDRVCQVSYDYEFYKMAKSEVRLPVGVRVVDAYTGKSVWEYTETITIRKRKPEQVMAK